VQVTGFINGLFGAVAGCACMVGPNLVALLVKHSSLEYNSMAWVGLSFYLLHFPAILVAMTSGRAALAALELEGLGEDLEEPLLRPSQPAESEHEAAPSPAGSRTFGTQWSTDVPSMPIGIRTSYDDGADITMPRTSLPGHVPVGSLTRQRSASHTWSLLHGSHHGHAPGSGSTTNAGTQSNTPGSAAFGYVLPRDVSPMGSLPRGHS
jgi:hypothetical protein